MKKLFFFLLVTFFISSMENVMGQTYQALWKQVGDAEKNDLPQTQRKVLGQIVKKAEREARYGHLLKALLLDAQTASNVSPDSLAPAVEKLKSLEQSTTNIPLKAVYQTVLACVYEMNRSLDDNWQQVSQTYKQQAVSHPAELAAVKTSDYEPFLEKGADSQLFGNDLLSVIGYETGQYEALHRYYLTTPNRVAQLFTALKIIEQTGTSAGLARIDSLIERYGNLIECGEAALLRLQIMESTGNPSAQEKVAFIDHALNRWGAWKRMEQLRNERNELTAKCFFATVPQSVWIPQREQQIALNNLRGINELTLTIYRADLDGNTQLNPMNERDYKTLKPLLKALPQKVTRKYSTHPDYAVYSDTMMLPALPAGVYMLEFQSLPATKVSRQLYFVSDLRVLTQPQTADNKVRFVAVNATSGHPVPGVSLRLTERSGRLASGSVTTVETNSKGEYEFTGKKGVSYEVFAATEEDCFCPSFNTYGWYLYNGGSANSEFGEVYTDRAIYRPGQTVHVGAILYRTENGFEHHAVEGKTVQAVLRDANRKVVAEKTLVTDAYGTVATDFQLPSSGLNGFYHVTVGNYSRDLRVEEYKRPTFQVEIPKPEQDYKDGDTLVVKATARSYAGVPVQGARVSYRVERRRAWWWVYSNHYWNTFGADAAGDQVNLFESSALTDDEGHFEVRIPLTMPETSRPLFYNFVVVADVTDVAGETHHGELSLPLGNRKTSLNAELDEKVLMESQPVTTFHLRNAAGTDLDATVEYRIDEGKWNTTPTKQAVSLPSLKSGKHMLEAVCAGDTLRLPFVVFSLGDKRPAAETDDWFYVSAQQFPDRAKPVTVQVGSSEKDVHLFYTIAADGKVIEQGAADKSNELLNRKFTYKNEYANGLALTFAWVKNGKVYQHTTTIRRPLPDKQLRMKWETFRDRLTPGQQEEWTLRILSPSGESLSTPAQLMAVLYDKSLDQIAKHQWAFEPYIYLPLNAVPWRHGSWGALLFEGAAYPDYQFVPELEFSHFDKSVYPSSWRTRGQILFAKQRVTGMPSMAKEVSASSVNAKMLMSSSPIGAFDVAGNDEESQTADATEARQSVQTEEAVEGTADVQLRENLQETAFFYPQLTADGQGGVTLRFTLPESLTTWRFMGLAHTPDMMNGLLEAEAVAKKDVMIQPNVPRFIRVGDEATVSARLFNSSNQEQQGTVRLVLTDPETGKVVYTSQSEVTLPAQATASETFRVNAARFDSMSLLVCKMTVEGASFSDGEQHYLPILPNRERVTVTMPFTQDNPGTKTISLNDYPDAKITVEYTNHPAWLMIQALPAVGHPVDNCAVCQAASYYANSVGRHIVSQNPSVRHLFEAWRNEKGSETSLMSALQKNEELKDIVLNETPWVADAEREVEQKQRLADFFDENLMNTRLASSLEQLRKLQNNDGSWSWWEGMPGSFFMTVEVSEMLVRLNQMTGRQEQTIDMLAKAFRFMDREMVELVEKMKEEEKKGHKQVFPTHKALQYLYLYAVDGRKTTAAATSAQSYLKKLLSKEGRNLSIHDKAVATIVLNSGIFLKSLNEWSTYKEGVGRYYDTPRAGYSWRDYRIPTQVAAIEAFKMLMPNDTTTIRQMQQWLLHEKRTQAWDTPINSVNAIYAFFNESGTSVDAASKLAPSTPAVLKVNGKALNLPAATVGIGYVKTVVPQDMMTKGDPATFTAEKTSSGTSWGAVYAQFMQPTHDIADQSSEISVRREILLPGDSPVKVGQRIRVRLVIEAQRDLDFVEVIDKRAACMEPVRQLSGYQNGAYCTPKDNATHYYYDMLSKGRHVIETEYYIDRAGHYETGTCTVQCAYAPEFRGTAHSQTIYVTE